jgi:hypothetical protein
MPTPRPPPFCPRLTTVKLPSPLELKGQTMLQSVPCQGPACAIFIMDFDEKGIPTGNGHCAEAVNAVANMRLAMAADAIAQEIVGEPDDETPPAPSADA